MGLTTFWSNITGPRIKEITPRKKTSSLDSPRPATSSGERAARKFSFEDVATEVSIGIQPPVTRAERKALRKSQAAGLARPKSSQGDVKTMKGHERSKSSQGNLKKRKSQDVGIARPKSSQRELKMPSDHHRQKSSQSEFRKLQSDDRPKSSQGELKKRSKSQDGLTALPAVDVDSRQDRSTRLGAAMAKQKSVPELARAKNEDARTAQAPEAKEDKREQRKSRRFSLSRPKAESELKKRKSIFGRKAEEVEQVPAVPSLPPLFTYELPADELPRPGTAVTTDERPGTAFTLDDRPGTASTIVKPFPPFSPIIRELAKAPPPVSTKITEAPVEQQKSRRMSIGAALSKKKRSKSIALDTGLSKRASWFQLSNSNSKADADVPPLPSMPIPTADFEPPVVARLRSEQRKSTAMSMFRERRSSTASQSRRKTWFQSSNLDDEDLDLSAFPPVPELASFPPVPGLIRDNVQTPELASFPPVPGLIRDNVQTPESSPPNSDSSDDIFDHSNFTMVRGDDFEQPRSLSAASRRSFAARNAANGFSKTTAGALEDAKETHRKPMKAQQVKADGVGADDKDGLIFSNKDQQREWRKLKNLMQVTDRRQGNDGVVDVHKDVNAGKQNQQQATFRNSESLSKLEFGVAR